MTLILGDSPSDTKSLSKFSKLEEYTTYFHSLSQNKLV